MFASTDNNTTFASPWLNANTAPYDQEQKKQDQQQRESENQLQRDNNISGPDMFIPLTTFQTIIHADTAKSNTKTSDQHVNKLQQQPQQQQQQHASKLGGQATASATKVVEATPTALAATAAAAVVATNTKTTTSDNVSSQTAMMHLPTKTDIVLVHNNTSNNDVQDNQGGLPTSSVFHTSVCTDAGVTTKWIVLQREQQLLYDQLEEQPGQQQEQVTTAELNNQSGASIGLLSDNNNSNSVVVSLRKEMSLKMRSALARLGPFYSQYVVNSQQRHHSSSSTMTNPSTMMSPDSSSAALEGGSPRRVGSSNTNSSPDENHVNNNNNNNNNIIVTGLRRITSGGSLTSSDEQNRTFSTRIFSPRTPLSPLVITTAKKYAERRLLLPSATHTKTSGAASVMMSTAQSVDTAAEANDLPKATTNAFMSQGNNHGFATATTVATQQQQQQQQHQQQPSPRHEDYADAKQEQLRDEKRKCIEFFKKAFASQKK